MIESYAKGARHEKKCSKSAVTRIWRCDALYDLYRKAIYLNAHVEHRPTKRAVACEQCVFKKRNKIYNSCNFYIRSIKVMLHISRWKTIQRKGETECCAFNAKRTSKRRQSFRGNLVEFWRAIEEFKRNDARELKRGLKEYSRRFKWWNVWRVFWRIRVF